MKINNALVVYTVPRTKEQKSALKIVEKILKKYRFSSKFIDRDKLKKNEFKNKDLAIAVGGDGTFLRAAQFIGEQLLLGINADPKNKEGFFMKTDKINFEPTLKKIIDGKAAIKKLPRLMAAINNKPIETLALNEFFIGAKKSYHAAKYLIKIGNKKERQKSSGVLVTTPAGSYSWAKSCCGKNMPLNSKNFQYIVREPYQGKIFKDYGLTYGLLKKSERVGIISEMLDGIIIADSVSKEYKFKEGSKAEIRLSRKKIKVIWR